MSTEISFSITDGPLLRSEDGVTVDWLTEKGFEEHTPGLYLKYDEESQRTFGYKLTGDVYIQKGPEQQPVFLRSHVYTKGGLAHFYSSIFEKNL